MSFWLIRCSVSKGVDADVILGDDTLGYPLASICICTAHTQTLHTHTNTHNWASKQTTTRIPVPQSLICVLSHTRHRGGSTMTKWIMKSQSSDSALGSFMPVWVNYLTLLHSSLFICKTRIGLSPPLKITWMRKGKTASEAINPAILASSPGT